MKQVTIHEAKTHLSRLVDLALAGEEVIIARRKQPLVRLSVLSKKPHTRRNVGALGDLVHAMGDGFNESMDDWSGGIIPAIPSELDSGTP